MLAFLTDMHPWHGCVRMCAFGWAYFYRIMARAVWECVHLEELIFIGLSCLRYKRTFVAWIKLCFREFYVLFLLRMKISWTKWVIWCHVIYSFVIIIIFWWTIHLLFSKKKKKKLFICYLVNCIDHCFHKLEIWLKCLYEKKKFKIKHTPTKPHL